MKVLIAQGSGRGASLFSLKFREVYLMSLGTGMAIYLLFGNFWALYVASAAAALGMGVFDGILTLRDSKREGVCKILASVAGLFVAWMTLSLSYYIGLHDFSPILKLNI